MTGSTNTQQGILDSLVQAILHGNLLEVRNIFKDNEDSNIQKILRLKWTSNELINSVLRVAIDFYNTHGQKEGIEIIELIWQKADQGTRDFLCREEYNLAAGGSVNVINMLRDLQEQGRTNDSNEVIQEMEEHKRVMALGYNLREAIMSLNVNQVKVALENCDTDIEKVLMRKVYWNGGGIDALLVFPLKVKYKRNLDKEEFEKVKEITKLLWDKASPDVRNFWLESCITNEEGQVTGDNYIIDSLEERQRMYANMAGEGWLEDFIQEVKDYRQQRDIELNDPILEEADKQILELTKQESLLTAPIAINTTEPTTDNNPPEKNDTTFWSKHKGKIALGAAVVCTAGAVAAYVLAYPTVALALAVFAAVILMGAGIAKVLEDPSVEGLSTSKEQRA